LFGVLCAFDSLFKGVFETVPVGDANACVLFAKIVVRPDSDVFIVRIPFDLVIQSARESVSTVGCSRFIFEYDIVLLPLGEISCDAQPDFARVAVVSEVCVVGVDYDRDGGPFE
jgi:hypothetical protein